MHQHLWPWWDQSWTECEEHPLQVGVEGEGAGVVMERGGWSGQDAVPADSEMYTEFAGNITSMIDINCCPSLFVPA